MSDEETIGSRLRAIRKDLAELTAKLNRDGNSGLAAKTQAVIVDLDKVRAEMKGYGFLEFEWNWEPIPDDNDD